MFYWLLLLALPVYALIRIVYGWSQSEERARRRSLYELRPDARDDHLKAVRLLFPQSRRRAAEIFAESFRKYRTPLAPHEQLRLTPALEALGELEIAARVLELSSAEDGIPASERQKLLLYEARLLVAMDLQPAAIHAYEGFLREFPDRRSCPIVAEKLAKLRRQEGVEPGDRSHTGPVRRGRHTVPSRTISWMA